MEFKAGERVKVLRNLMGITRTDFAEMVDIDFVRLKNVEQQNARMSEDEFAKIGAMFPEIVPWLVYEGDIDMENLKRSDQKLCRLIAAKIEAGIYPEGFHLEEKFK